MQMSLRRCCRCLTAAAQQLSGGGGQVLLDCDPEAAELKGKLGNLPLHTAAEFSGVLCCCGRRLDTGSGAGGLDAVQLLIATHK